MVRDARSWLADAEATLAVCQENKKKEDGMDYGTMRDKALEDWKETEATLLAAIKRLHDLHNLIRYSCDPKLEGHTPLSVAEPFRKISNLRNALKRTEVRQNAAPSE